MLTPPDLATDVLVAVLARHWRLAVASMAYRPVGFGSHHWEVVDTGGALWFVTVDELDSGFERLRAALAAARDLRDRGLTFVVAPVPTVDGEPVAQAGDRFAVALYPFIEGQSFSWGEFSSPEHRRAVLDMIVAVHASKSAYAMADDFTIPHRDELFAASAGEPGPFSRPMAKLLAENEAPVRRLLARYDELAAAARSQPSRAVLTHGEPHPGNTILTSEGWVLIDWDTALVAPPERDLWGFDAASLDAYAEMTGVRVLRSMVELYRLRWDLADIAASVHRFRRPHTASPDDVKSWEILRSLVTRRPA